MHGFSSGLLRLRRFLFALTGCVVLASCASSMYRSSQFPIMVTKGSVHVRLEFIPLKSYEVSPYGANDYDYDAYVKETWISSINDKEIPPYENNVRYPVSLYDPRNPVEKNETDTLPAITKNTCEYTEQILQQNETLRRHIPRGFRIQAKITNNRQELAEITCGTRLFQLKKGQTKTLHFYH